jgi:hypothetical protein
LGEKGVVSSNLGGRVGFTTGKPQPPSSRADRTRNEELAVETSGSRRGKLALNTNCEDPRKSEQEATELERKKRWIKLQVVEDRNGITN